MNNTETQGLNHPVHVICGTARIGSQDIALRSGDVLIATLVDAYMSVYSGKDQSISQRMRWWQAKIGHLTLSSVDEDHIYFALQELSQQSARYYCGKDADGKPIYKSKKRPYTPATLNRYVASAGALFTWCIRQRIAPKGWVHPCRGIERKPENNEITRFLSNAECERVIAACKASTWPKLYLLVLLGLTTGARRGELERLRWRDIDLERQQAYVYATKNGDKKVLTLTNAVIQELSRFIEAPERLVIASVRCPNKPFSHEHVWHKALKAAKVHRFRFHDLRHTCASYLAQNGATLLEIGDVLGQRQQQVTKRYSHLTTGHKAALVNRVLGSIN
jgi:integrase